MLQEIKKDILAEIENEVTRIRDLYTITYTADNHEDPEADGCNAALRIISYYRNAHSESKLSGLKSISKTVSNNLRERGIFAI